MTSLLLMLTLEVMTSIQSATVSSPKIFLVVKELIQLSTIRRN